MSNRPANSQSADPTSQVLPPRVALTDFAHLGADKQQSLDAIAQKVLENPIELEKLNDLVCNLLEQDIRFLSERGRMPGRY